MSISSFPGMVVPLLPILHAGGPIPTGPWYTHWRLEPGVALLVVGLLAAYFVLTGPVNRRSPGWEARVVTPRQRACFVGAVATLLVALGPPLDDWSGYLLLSAHMFQHVLLLVVVPPLLLLGLPAWLLEPLTRNRWTDRAGYWLTRPQVSLLLLSLGLVVWHIPRFYDAAINNQPIHELEHVTYLLTGVLSWWAIVGPLPAWPRLPPLGQCLFLFLTTIPCGVVGAVITLASSPLYSAYDGVPRMWGLDPLTDQQIAGLMMWVGENTLYLLVITVIFFRWSAGEERKDREARTRRRPAAATQPSAGGTTPTTP